MATNSASQLKIGLTVATVMIVMFAGICGIIAGGMWIDFQMTDDRNRVACVTGWDARFEPKYEGSTCSILQVGYRVPLDSYTNEPASVRNPEERDATAW